MKNTLMKKLFLIILFVLLSDVYCNENMTFYENENNLRPTDIITYADDTVVFRLIKRLNETCNESRLMFRILYSNGTSEVIIIHDHNIPPYNFCTSGQPIYIDNFLVNFYSDELMIFKTIPNYILVIYKQFTNLFGMMIEWNGNIKSNTLLGSTRILDNFSKFKLEVVCIEADNQYEYWFFEKLQDSTNIIFKKFKTVSDKGELVNIQEDLVQMPENYQKFYLYRTIKSEMLFVIIYNSTTSNITSNAFSLEPEWRIYGSILQKDINQLSDPFLIYQTSVSSIVNLKIDCIQVYDGNGFYCIMLISRDINAINYAMIKVTFLSNGKITETKTETNYDTTNINDFALIGLKSGGIAIGTIRMDRYGCEMTGYFLQSNAKNRVNPIPTVHLDYECFIATTNNNSVLVIPEKRETYWTLLNIDIPQLMNDKGYDSPIINWTVPAINDVIALTTTQIQIAYNMPIMCSSQNISIYQKLDDGKEILRETYSAPSKNCQVLSDNTSLSLAVLPSTFNHPKSTYYIKVDTDFVKQNKTLEPLLGISKNRWIFTTESRKYMIDDSINGFLRLTNQGTLYFESLSSKEKSSFLQDLSGQLAEIIPVQSHRIKSNNDYQIDTKAPLYQILISIKVIKSDNDSELDVQTIIDNLDNLVRHKGTTLISMNNLTSSLDDTYGFQKYRTFIDIITIPIIAMAIILFLLFLCYILAHLRHKEGKNFVIIIIAFMLYDFIMDLLFIFDLKDKNLLLLFQLSLIFTIPPILINLFTAVYIVIQENSKNPRFYDYFIKNTVIVSVCSVLAGTDIEVLHFLSSKIANLEIFSAQFSKKAEDYIFWCALIGFLFEDIPQFGIQIAYKISRIDYTIIPALTLISSILMLLINIIGRLHNAIIKCKNTPSIVQESDNNDESTDNSEMKYLEQQNIENNSYTRKTI